MLFQPGRLPAGRLAQGPAAVDSLGFLPGCGSVALLLRPILCTHVLHHPFLSQVPLLASCPPRRHRCSLALSRQMVLRRTPRHSAIRDWLPRPRPKSLSSASTSRRVARNWRCRGSSTSAKGRNSSWRHLTQQPPKESLGPASGKHGAGTVNQPGSLPRKPREMPPNQPESRRSPQIRSGEPNSAHMFRIRSICDHVGTVGTSQRSFA